MTGTRPKLPRDEILAKTRQFEREVGRLHKELAKLRSSRPGSASQLDLELALEGLATTLEELHVAHEQVHEQNEFLNEAHERLENERRRYQDLFDFSTSGLLVTDTAGVIQEANRAAAGLLGVGKTSLVGKPLSVFVAEPYHTGFYDLLRRLERVDRILDWELSLRSRGGHYLPVELSAAVMRTRSGEQGPSIIVRWSIRDIRERKRAEDELRDSEARLSAILDTAADAIVTIDEEGIIQSVNAAAEDMFGYGPGELIGRNVKVLMPSPYREEHDGYLVNYLETGEARIIGIGREVPGLRKDGSTLDLDLAVSKFEINGQWRFTGILRDISERREREDRLRLYQQMVSASHDLMSFVGPDYVYRAANDAYTEVYGLQPSEVVGRRIADLLGTEFFESNIKARMDECLTGRLVRYEIWVDLPRLGRRYLDVRYDPHYGADGTVEGIVVHVRDLTDRERLQEEILRHQAELAHAGRIAAIGELTSSITHELKQPLTAIVSYAEAGVRLQKSGDQSRLVAALRGVVKQSRRAIRVAERLRRFGRREHTSRTPLDVNEAIRDAVGLMRHDLQLHDVELHLELDRALSRVAADKLEIEQVLVNLLRNAVDAMADTPRAERTVTIRTAVAAGGVAVAVSDCGVGLPVDDPERVMEAFYTTKPKGTGLGLSISRGIVEACGGRLWAENNAAAGATFHFTLPAVEGAGQAAPGPDGAQTEEEP